MTSFTINDSKMMLLNQPRRPKSLLETFADRPIKDNKYLILESQKGNDGSEIPTVMKEFKINTKLMKADIRSVKNDKYAPLINKSYVSLPSHAVTNKSKHASTRNMHLETNEYQDSGAKSLAKSSSRLSHTVVFKPLDE